ncbi:MAG: hypothetical protein KDN18_11100 [Verrucomicrobiae bacterium]|nr:hypothetical protein [Verrucomicrobiae bacterium]
MKMNSASSNLFLAAGLAVLILQPLLLRSQDAAEKPADAAVSTTALESVKATTGGSASSAVSGGTVAGATGATAIEFPGKTDLDDPGNKDQRLLLPVDAEGKVSVAWLSKIDLDADLDYDGRLDNDSDADQGQHEAVPPGLELGKGEVSRLVIRFKTYEQTFPGTLVVALEVEGVNRDSASGAFSAGGQKSVGRVKVWRDQARKELLVDSGDPAKLRHEWRYDSEKRSGGIPRTLYIEGVEVSSKFEGDLRLLLSASHQSDGATPGTVSSLYRSAFDHLLVTVRKEPVEKEFINNNVEGVWSKVGDSPVAVAEVSDDVAKESGESKAESR